MIYIKTFEGLFKKIQGRYNSPVDEGITIVKNIKEFEKQLRLFKKDVFAITIKLKIY